MVAICFTISVWQSRHEVAYVVSFVVDLDATCTVSRAFRGQEPRHGLA
jgi:hypothetical protein